MIVCCGEALVDRVPEGSGEDAWLATPGGCPYNTAIAAARLGANAAFLGGIGIDFLGEMLLEKLGTNGVDLRFVSRRPAPATLAFVKRPPGGEARYRFYFLG